MTTVKEFKDLGVEFVMNDKVSNLGFDSDRVMSFAWRTNTGVKPKFNGVVEVKLRSGRVVVPSEVINQGGRVVWGLDGDQCDIVEWRPLLDQPKKSAYDVDAHVSCGRAKGGVIPNNILGQMHEVDKRETVFNKIPGSDNDVYAIDSSDCDCEITVRYKPALSIFTTDRFPKIKPVFTKEFAIRGGSSTPFVWESCIVKYIGSKYVVLIDSNGREHSRKKAKLMIRDIDTRTPKQKAVEEMLSDSRCSGSVIEVALERLYDKGYRKC